MLEQWESTIAAGGTPTNLFEDQDYLDSLFADSTATTVKSDAALARSNDGVRATPTTTSC